MQLHVYHIKGKIMHKVKLSSFAVELVIAEMIIKNIRLLQNPRVNIWLIASKEVQITQSSSFTEKCPRDLEKMLSVSANQNSVILPRMW